MIRVLSFPLLFCCVLFAVQHRKVSDQYTVPLNYVIANDCTGEEIQLNGRMHVQYTALETPNGWRAESMSNYNGVSGTGLSSGRTYRLVGSGRTNVDFRRPFPAHNTVVDSVRLISEGGAPNSHYKLHWHFTFSADGKLSVEFDRAETECRGGR